jgi:exosortase
MSTHVEKSENDVGRHKYFGPLTWCLLVPAILFLPVMIPYFGQLWLRDYYQFYPFAIATTVWFVLARGKQQPELRGTRLRWGLRATGFVVGELAVLYGLVTGSPWVCFIGFMVLLGLILDCFTEVETGRSLLYLLLPMLLVVRPPLNYDKEAVQWLQELTTQVSSDFLNTLNYDHILQGNIIQPAEGTALMVAEACSGVQSLFTLMFIASFIGISRSYPVVRTLLLVGTGVFWALLMNVCRVLTIAVAQIQFQQDLTSGWKHDLVGYAAMLLAIPFLLSTDKLILFVFDVVSDDPRKHQKINVLVLAWNWAFGQRRVEIPVESGRSRRSRSGRESGDEVGSLGQSWRSLPSRERLMLLGAVILAALTVLPAWVLPGFLRSPRVEQASLSPDATHWSEWMETTELCCLLWEAGMAEEVVADCLVGPDAAERELRRGRGV